VNRPANIFTLAVAAPEASENSGTYDLVGTHTYRQHRGRAREGPQPERIANFDPMRDASQLSDDDLLLRVRAGDEEAFTTLYRRRQAAVYRFALQMSGSPSVAEEVTQEVFLVLIRHPGQFDPAKGSLASFLFGVARNRVLRCLERERWYVPMAEDSLENDSSLGQGCTPTSLEDPLDGLTQRETIERVRQAVQALPLNYREVVILCDLQELSYKETAQALGCVIGTVRSRLHRARALLVEKLQVAAGDRKPAAGDAPCCTKGASHDV
jgi:RNA polymerase sigma-70 factor (ECF subfamily)